MYIYSILYLEFHSISISNTNLIARNETWKIKLKELDHLFKSETEETSPSRIHTGDTKNYSIWSESTVINFTMRDSLWRMDLRIRQGLVRLEKDRVSIVRLLLRTPTCLHRLYVSESCHMYECVVLHMKEFCIVVSCHVWMSHVTCMQKDCDAAHRNALQCAATRYNIL